MTTSAVKASGTPSPMDHIKGLASHLQSTLSSVKKGGGRRKRGGNPNPTMKHSLSSMHKGGSRKIRGGSTSSYTPSVTDTSTPFSNSKSATMSGGKRRKRRSRRRRSHRRR